LQQASHPHQRVVLSAHEGGRAALPVTAWSLDQPRAHGIELNVPRGDQQIRLTERRAIRHRSYPPDLTIPQILAWAEAFLARTGQWPNRRSGPILEAPGESWRIIERTLRAGGRSLEGGLSLRRLRDPAKHDESAQASGRMNWDPFFLDSDFRCTG